MNPIAQAEHDRRAAMHERELRILLQRLVDQGGYSTITSLAVPDDTGFFCIHGKTVRFPDRADLLELERRKLVARTRSKHTIWHVTDKGREWIKENPA